MPSKPSLRFFDNTRLKDYRRCPRYFFFRHVMGWTREGSAPALGFGLGWHSGLDEIWQMISENRSVVSVSEAGDLARLGLAAWQEAMEESGIDYRSPMYSTVEPKRTEGVAHEMFYEYVKARMDFIKSVELLSTERPFAVPLGDLPDTYYIGRVDKEISQDGKIRVIDHKTTSDYRKAGGFSPAFLESFSPDPQIDGYAYAAYLKYGKDFRNILIDAALVHKTEHRFFKIIPVQRTFQMLDSWLWEAENWVRRIDEDLSRLEEASPDDPFLKAFPHKEACYDYYRSCVYKDLCRFVPNPLADEPPEGFVYQPWNPFEINKIYELGLEEN